MKRKTLNGRILSLTRPASGEIEIISVKDFAIAVERLSRSYLLGAMEVNITELTDDDLALSLSCTALLLREMIKYSEYDEYLTLNIDTKDGISMHLEYRNELCDKEKNELIRLADNAGFKISINEKAIDIFAPAATAKTIKVLARSLRDFYKILIEVFFM